jgi:hypothetical protein
MSLMLYWEEVAIYGNRCHSGPANALQSCWRFEETGNTGKGI